MIFNPKDKRDFQSATKCHICEQDLFRDKETGQILKVRDHCHFTGEYRGAAHNQCHLKCKKPLILLVIFHNLQGYDSRLFMKQLAKVSGDLSCIPSTEEKYISFSKKIVVDQFFSKKMGKPIPKKFEIRFIDSLKFLSTSLNDLVENLEPSDFKNLNRVIKDNSSLLARKGVYPYDYITSMINSKKQNFQQKKTFIQNCMIKKFQVKIINMHSKFGILSIVKLFKTITIFISNLMFFFLQTFLRISEKLVCIIINLIHVIIIQLLVFLGMLVSKEQTKN